VRQEHHIQRLGLKDQYRDFQIIQEL
jgi:hypothetical protein